MAKEKAPKERPPYDLVATRLPCPSRRHWCKNKLASLKQIFASSNEGCDARLHRRDEGQNPSPKKRRRSLAPSSLAEHRRDFAKKRAVSEGAKRPSLARAQNPEERKGPHAVRRGIGCAFFWFRFLCTSKENEHAASVRKKVKQLNGQLRNVHKF